jgi:hypothetical protein
MAINNQHPQLTPDDQGVRGLGLAFAAVIVFFAAAVGLMWLALNLPR